MSEYLKPQSPLQYKGEAYIYPLTTVDQVILEDNTRLNVALDDINAKIENIDFDNINIEGLDDALTVELKDIAIGTPNTINADSLGGKSADEFALRSDVESLKNTPFIPQVSTEDNGKFLRVVDGVWAAVALPNAEGVGF